MMQGSEEGRVGELQAGSREWPMLAKEGAPTNKRTQASISRTRFHQSDRLLRCCCRRAGRVADSPLGWLLKYPA